MKLVRSYKLYWSGPYRDALWFTLLPCGKGKSKEVQIKSNLIRWFHRALQIKALHPTMHKNSLEMTPYGECNLKWRYISLCLFMAGELIYVDTEFSICSGRGKISDLLETIGAVSIHHCEACCVISSRLCC